MVKSKDFTMALKTGSGRTCSRALMTGRLCLGSPCFANGKMGPTVLNKLIRIIQQMGHKTVRVLCKLIQKKTIGEKARIPRAPPRPHAHMVLYFAQRKRLQM